MYRYNRYYVSAPALQKTYPLIPVVFHDHDDHAEDEG